MTLNSIATPSYGLQPDQKNHQRTVSELTSSKDFNLTNELLTHKDRTLSSKDKRERGWYGQFHTLVVIGGMWFLTPLAIASYRRVSNCMMKGNESDDDTGSGTTYKAATLHQKTMPRNIPAYLSK